jgi:uncharacterized protein (DUF924 family)
MTDVAEVLSFWFGDAPARTAPELVQKVRRWYQGGPELDREIGQRFSTAVDDAIAGRFDAWTAHAEGRVALLVLLDQFPRSIHRDTPKAYAGDARAVALAREMDEDGSARDMPLEHRQFAMMPFVHAEDLEAQALGVRAARELHEDAPAELRPVFAMGVEQSAKYFEIIRRFGRFPHRNAILSRESTPQELEFLRDWAEKAAPSAIRQLG